MTSTTALPAIRENSAREIAAPASAPYNPSIGYLRAFITLLVLAHHAVLAYHPFAPPPAMACT